MERSLETLQQVATHLITAHGEQELYDQIVDTALIILHADFASLQLVRPGLGTDIGLKLLGHSGFSSQTAKLWEWVGPESRTACGEALRTRQRVIVSDIRNCDFLAGSDLDAFLEAGINAVQATPLVSRSGTLLGMISTHWRESHEMTTTELRASDILGRLAADVIERSRTDDNLRDALKQLQVVTENMTVGVIQCSLDLCYLWVSPSMATWYGLTPKDMVGHPILEIIGPKAYKTIQPHIERVLSGKKAEYEAQVDYRGAGLRWVHAVYVPTRGQDHEVDGWIAVVTDATDRHEAEERLRASERQLKEAQRLAKVGSWERIFDAENGDSSYWSEEMARILDLPNKSASFPRFVNCIHPKDRNKVLELEEYVRSTHHGPIELEYRIIRPNGELRFLHSVVEAIRNDQGVAVRLTGATQDVTEQVEARELLRESEQHLKNAERLSHLGHWSWNLKSKKGLCSEEYCRILGRPRDYTPSYEEFLQNVLPQDRERVDLVVGKALARKTGYTIEFQIARPTGEIRSVRAIAELLLDEEGLPLSFLGTCQDITDLKHAQAEAAARQKLESVGTLASGIAHDFNNLLGAVLVQAEVALQELATGSNPQNELKAIRNVALRGSEIVRELMVYAGKEAAVVELVDVSRIVKDMLELLNVSVSKHAVVKHNLAEDLPLVSANAAQLRQMVMNLITNASDAIGHAEGIIRVTTKRVKIDNPSDNHSTPDDLLQNDYVELEVADNGCGMSRETQNRVFDPFFSTKSAGRGLGLAVVQRIVQSLNGTINLTSQPGEGTTFQILLPCTETSSGAKENAIPGAEELAVPTQAGTVMVVEDENQLRHAVVKMLRRTGFQVLEAPDGSSAIDLLRAHGDKVDVILLDATIPGASSHEVVVEATNIRPNIKVILASAYSQEMLADLMNTASQIKSFIRKPFRVQELVEILRKTLSPSSNALGKGCS